MLLFVGDTHAHWAGLKELEVQLEQALAPEWFAKVRVVQVGDFGWGRHVQRYWQDLKLPVYAIDGNHDDHAWLAQFDNQLTEVRPNLFYVPRGQVLELAGVTIGFAGGAASVDGYWRVAGTDWWPEAERLRREQVAHLLTRDVDLDILVTHTPSTSMIKAHWPPLNLREWKLPAGWHDTSADVVEELYQIHHTAQFYSGHMHRSVMGANYRVLGINEMVWWPPHLREAQMSEAIAIGERSSATWEDRP